MVRIFALGVACMGLVAACAMGGAKRASAPAETTAAAQTAAPPTAAAQTDAQTMPVADPRAEIERLSADIDARAGTLQLAPPPAGAALPDAQPMSSTPLSTDATCKPAKTDRCTQACTLSDSICDNAKRICDLAQQLTADAWAADKCSRAKQTCATAHDNCCGCQ